MQQHLGAPAQDPTRTAHTNTFANTRCEHVHQSHRSCPHTHSRRRHSPVTHSLANTAGRTHLACSARSADHHLPHTKHVPPARHSARAKWCTTKATESRVAGANSQKCGGGEPPSASSPVSPDAQCPLKLAAGRGMLSARSYADQRESAPTACAHPSSQLHVCSVCADTSINVKIHCRARPPRPPHEPADEHGGIVMRIPPSPLHKFMCKTMCISCLPSTPFGRAR